MISALLFALVASSLAYPYNKTLVEQLNDVAPNFGKLLNETDPELYTKMTTSTGCECNVFNEYAYPQIAEFETELQSCQNSTLHPNTTSVNTCLKNQVCTPVSDLSAKYGCMNHFNSTLPKKDQESLAFLISLCKASAVNVSITFNNTCDGKIATDYTVFSFTNGTAAGNQVKYHVVATAYAVSQLGVSQYLPSLAIVKNVTQLVHTEVSDRTHLSVTLNFGTGESTAAVAEHKCSNGFIHMMANPLALPKSVSQTLRDNGKFSSLIERAKATGTELDDIPRLTLLAPNDNAFNNFSFFDNLSKDAQTMTLTTHAIGAIALSTDLTDGESLLAANGQTLKVHINGSHVSFSIDEAGDNANVVQANMVTESGVIHVLDSVLRPVAGKDEGSKFSVLDNLLLNPELKTLSTILESGNAPNALKAILDATDLTLFAPNDAALAAFNATGQDLDALLQYHAIPAKTIPSVNLNAYNRVQTLLTDSRFVDLGKDVAQDVIVHSDNTSGVTIQSGYPDAQAQVTQADVKGKNGIVHVINKVLAIPASTSATVKKGNFSAMLKLVSSVQHLADRLDGKTDGPLANETAFKNFTFFVAADKYYDDLSLSSEGNETATEDVLLDQVYAKDRLFSDFLAGFNGTLTMEGGGKYNVSQNSNGEIFVGGHKVIQADVLTKNGVVHVLSGVLGESNSSGLSTGVYAAIIVGAVAILCMLCYCCTRSKDGNDSERMPFAPLADE